MEEEALRSLVSCMQYQSARNYLLHSAINMEQNTCFNKASHEDCLLNVEFDIHDMFGG